MSMLFNVVFSFFLILCCLNSFFLGYQIGQRNGEISGNKIGQDIAYSSAQRSVMSLLDSWKRGDKAPDAVALDIRNIAIGHSVYRENTNEQKTTQRSPSRR